jgi:hypothetical protein
MHVDQLGWDLWAKAVKLRNMPAKPVGIGRARISKLHLTG